MISSENSSRSSLILFSNIVSGIYLKALLCFFFVWSTMLCTVAKNKWIFSANSIRRSFEHSSSCSGNCFEKSFYIFFRNSNRNSSQSFMRDFHFPLFHSCGNSPRIFFIFSELCWGIFQEFLLNISSRNFPRNFEFFKTFSTIFWKFSKSVFDSTLDKFPESSFRYSLRSYTESSFRSSFQRFLGNFV